MRGWGRLAKMLKDGASYSQREVVDLLVEFSSFKDRVQKRFKVLANELDGKNNEHDLWVNLYLISSDYAEESSVKRQKQVQADSMQKIS